MFSKLLFVTSLILVFTPYLYAQSEVDSLSLLIKNTPTNHLKIDYISSLSRIYRFSQPDSAVFWAKQGLLLAQKLNYKKGIATFLNHLGVNHWLRGNYDSATYLLDSTLKISQKINYEEGLASAYNNLGLVYKEQGMYAKAFQYFRKTVELDTKLNNREGVPVGLNNIGMIHEVQGNYDSASYYYLKALQLFEQNDDKEGQRYTSNNVGNIYDIRKNYAQAYYYYQKSLSLAKSIDDKQGISMAMTNLGSLSYKQKKYDSALYYFQNALAISKQIEEKEGIAENYLALANTYSSTNKDFLAEKYYFEALNLYQQLKNKEKTAHTLFNFAHFDYHKNNLANSQIKAKKALQMAQEIGAAELVKEISYLLYDIFYQKKDYQQALNFYILSRKISDSLLSMEKEKMIQELQTNFEIQQKQSMIDKLHQQQKQKELQIAYKNNQLIFVSIIFVMLTTLLIIGILYTRKKRELEKSINQKKLAEIAWLNSHVVRAPLATILGLVQLFDKENPSSEENVQIIKYLQESAEKLDKVIKEVVQKTYAKRNTHDT
ncbi:tetratricopeptide repeat protein [Thermoflexibacter ruber]|uniref:histidine kinase n=1 Tax=Thermoflexibacter ruber TaxID=1003 RepID=A0A1I2B189_9BACT|nr:tetratricopeptide repeat protein [Thermoflexibacter ruber]SFE49809.1 Tetratricopeptide repeat-containing protein [Thermoflexibacter ruber]